jgi:hypothetical protein
MGKVCIDFVPARDAYHGRGVWDLGGLFSAKRHRTLAERSLASNNNF